MQRKLAQRLAIVVDARLRCQESDNIEWQAKHESEIEKLIYNYMPSGSGIDNGTKIDLEKSHGEKLVFHTAFHHMDESGFYAGWTHHTVTVKACLMGGLNIKISGPNRNEIKDYLGDVFDEALNQIVDPPISADAQDLITA